MEHFVPRRTSRRTPSRRTPGRRFRAAVRGGPAAVRSGLGAIVLASLAAVAGCTATVSAVAGESPSPRSGSSAESDASTRPGDPIPGPGQRSPGTPAGRQALPGIGPHTMREIPRDSTQVVVSSTPAKDGTRAHTTLYELTDDGSWKAAGDWSGHNGENGWNKHRSVGDSTTPVGVFGLTDAGGYLKNPGTELTYDRDRTYRTAAAATYGRKFKKVFNYVIAINFNRVPGSDPTDSRHPHGAARGGKIWLHVDHESPTHGCITLSQAGVKYLLTHLDPKDHPVIVTGPQSVISR